MEQAIEPKSPRDHAMNRGRGRVQPRVRWVTVPPGSQFQGYQDFLVQDLVLRTHPARAAVDTGWGFGDAADFTNVWTAEGWLYIAVVTDLFSRRVGGWSMSATMAAQFVADVLVMAIWRRGRPRALLHHSERRSQYSSEEFQRAAP